MLVITVMAARWIVRRLAVPPTWSSRLGMGSIALALMLFAEFTLVLSLRGMSLRDYLATRDPVAGTVYYAALVVFALMPLILTRARRDTEGPGSAHGRAAAAPLCCVGT